MAPKRMIALVQKEIREMIRLSQCLQKICLVRTQRSAENSLAVFIIIIYLQRIQTLAIKDIK